MRNRSFSTGAVLVALLAADPIASAAQSRLTPATTTAPARADYDRAAAEVERHVRERYVDAKLKPAVLAVLAEGRRSGRYARSESPQAFAAQITQDLQRASSDGHMYMNWAPEQHRAMSAPEAAGPASGQTYWRERTRRENSGLVDQRVLDGNVRYLKVAAFLWDDALSPPDYDAAMRFLKGGEAVILDLRGNGGGSPDAVAYLASHFVPPETKLMTFVMAGVEEISTARKDVPAGRLAGKPVYVLIDKGVASAGEEFALHVDKFRFGELIGETTAGGGNRNELFPIAPGFMLSVSVGLAKHGTDGSGWEGVGIKPHLAVAADRALDTAHASALQRLAATGPEALRADYAWAAEGVRSRAEPVTLSPDALARFAGVYGERVVRVAGDGLTWRRAEQPEVRLAPMSADRFRTESDNIRFVFEMKDGRPAAVAVSYKDGRRDRFERTG